MDLILVKAKEFPNKPLGPISEGRFSNLSTHYDTQSVAVHIIWLCEKDQALGGTSLSGFHH
jgi:hypothetical protein